MIGSATDKFEIEDHIPDKEEKDMMKFVLKPSDYGEPIDNDIFKQTKGWKMQNRAI